MSDSNSYSTYQMQTQKKEASRNDAVALGSKSDEYLDVEMSMDSTKGKRKESFVQTINADKVVIQRQQLLLLIVFTACSMTASISMLIYGSIRTSAVVSEYDKITTENTEFRELIEDLQFKIYVFNFGALLNQVK